MTPEEFELALDWVKKYCKEGLDENPDSARKSRAEKDLDWETVVKMTMIARDLMVGNPKLTDLGYGEEGLGHNAIVIRFPGTATVDRSFSERRFYGSRTELFI